MRRYFIYSFIAISMFFATGLFAQTTMTDQQVLDFVKQEVSLGKSQKDIAQELVVKGVNRAQIARVKKLYESQNGTESIKNEESVSGLREHRQNDEHVEDTGISSRRGVANLSQIEESAESVFGRSVFRNENLTFEHSLNMPTPKNYVLGPGDEVIVDVFGANQSTIRSVISPEGYINVDVLGPIYLSGKTVDSANKYLKEKLSSIYGGLSGNDSNSTDIQVSLGQIRSIQVSIIGEVETPGTYMVSSLSTVFNALFKVGGIKEPGTVRSIKVVRNNKVLTAVDVYDFLIYGNRKNDVRLEDGDVILVEPYDILVKADGLVKRPMYYELKANETISDLLKFAGGFGKSAYTGNVSVIRQAERDSLVLTVEASEFNNFVLHNGDEVEIRKMDARFENRIEIIGSVYLPGVYELGNDVNSVRKLVAKAGGILPEAFTERAIILRHHNDRSLETFAVDIEGILGGSKPDVPLQKNDVLNIQSIYDLKDQGTLTINGEVASPGVFPFAEKTTVKDLILQAGGLLRSASIVRVDVARMITDNESLVAQKDISTYYTFSIKNGFTLDEADEFVLEPYDVVTVRRSPSYVTNKVVTISGEVNFPGNYNMSKREERITDLVAKAGDVTDFAYLQGARLIRRMTAAEREQYNKLTGVISAMGDSADVEMNLTTYDVAFDMVDALKNPGGSNDLVLREGDELTIPVLDNTVRIGGAVQMPTSIRYRKGLNKRIVIDAAGGYAKMAHRRKVFIVYMNGRVTKLGRFTNIEPGCQVIVPKKEKKEGQLQQIMSISTTAASLGMMGVSIANLLK